MTPRENAIARGNDTLRFVKFAHTVYPCHARDVVVLRTPMRTVKSTVDNYAVGVSLVPNLGNY